MKRGAPEALFPRLLILLVVLLLAVLLGLAPRSHGASLAMQQAGQAITNGLPQEAAKNLVEAAERLPWRSDLWEAAGHYALQAGDPQSAIRHFNQAETSTLGTGVSSSSSLSLQSLTDLGEAYQQIGDLPQAIQAWEQAAAVYGRSGPLLQRLVQAHLASGDFQAAIADMEKLAFLQPEQPDNQYLLGLLLATQQPEAALQPLAKAAELDPSLEQPVSQLRRSIMGSRTSEDPAYALLNSGRTLASLDRWDLAAEAFRQATLARPDYAEAWAYLGEARQHQTPVQASGGASVPPEAGGGLPELRKALQLDPKSLAARTFLALYWSRQSSYDQALEAIQSALDLDPGNPALKVEQAWMLAASGDLYEAFEAFQEAIKLSPYDPIYSRHLVDFSLQYDFQIEEIALPVARRLVIQNPQDPASLDLMAQVLIQRGDLSSARRFLQRALQADANYAPAHLHLGLAYVLTGDREAALHEFGLAASLAPGSPLADQVERLLGTYFP